MFSDKSEKNKTDISYIKELNKRINENDFNSFTQKHFHVNEKHELVIKGIQQRVVLSTDEQIKLIKDIQLIVNKKILDEEISFLESLALNLLLQDTY